MDEKRLINAAINDIWKLIPSPSGPEYRIYDRINECSIEGGFDTQKWAEAVAEMMEEKWKNDIPRPQR